MRRIPILQRFLSICSLTIFPLLFATTFAIQAQNTGKISEAKAEGNLPSPAAGQDCVACHAEIVRSYAETSMAKASGTALQSLIPGEFTHVVSGVHYRIYQASGKALLSFDRGRGESVEGTRELLYFIGSGQRGRTYLFSQDGYVFESPVNWYAQSKNWDMTPAYRSATHIPLNLPAAVSCFHCHTSGFHAPAPGTENKYAEPLFSQPGISCERCHGDGDAHAKSTDRMLNLGKLSPAQRDAICMQCHLEGNVAIEQPGKHLYDFKPGDNLFEYVHYLVLSTGRHANPRAVSQFEALAESICKRKSGDALHCTTCHDPHRSPSPEERINYYRAKCLACHGEEVGKKHKTKNPDCTSCHMPRVASSDVAHTQGTDHRILRQANSSAPTASSELTSKPRLERFPALGDPPTDRDLVLGWLALAEAGSDFAMAQEENLLPLAAEEYPRDATILSAYAYRELLQKRTQHAKELYTTALQIDPMNLDAAVNLGVIEAQSGSAEKALTLWRDASQRAPWRTSIGMNMARLACDLGNTEEAKISLRRCLQFNPDFPEARQFLRELESQPAPCGLH
jgi:predicted CXXCH cytochrome family protein